MVGLCLTNLLTPEAIALAPNVGLIYLLQVSLFVKAAESCLRVRNDWFREYSRQSDVRHREAA